MRGFVRLLLGVAIVFALAEAQGADMIISIDAVGLAIASGCAPEKGEAS